MNKQESGKNNEEISSFIEEISPRLRNFDIPRRFTRALKDYLFRAWAEIDFSGLAIVYVPAEERATEVTPALIDIITLWDKDPLDSPEIIAAQEALDEGWKFREPKQLQIMKKSLGPKFCPSGFGECLERILQSELDRGTLLGSLSR